MIWKTTPGSIFAPGLSDICLKGRFNSFLLLAMLSVASLFQLEEVHAQVIPVLQPNGGFEIDGNLVASPVGGDWVPAKNADGTYNTAAGNFVFFPDGTPVNTITSAIAIDKWSSSQDDVFSGGEKANENPGDWTYTYAKANPQKGDINNAFYHIAQNSVTLDDWLFVGSDRYSNKGTSYIDFEFFQNPVYKDPNSNRFIAEGPDGGRTENDLMISLTYEQGGSSVNVEFFLWLDEDGDGVYEYVNQPLSSVDAFASGNSSSVDVPFGAFGSKSYDAYLFAEAGLNMTNIFKDLSHNGICAGVAIKSFLVKTKNSGSVDASINDYIGPVPIELILGSAEVSYVPNEACQSTGTVSPVITGVQNGMFTASSTDLAIDTNGVIDVENSVPGTYTITYSFESYGCQKSTTTQFEVIGVPVAPETSQEYKDGAFTQCEQSPIQSLDANDALATYSGTVTWYDAPTAGNIVNPVLNTVGTKTYYAELNNGTCNSISRTPVTLTINPAVVATITGKGDLSCTNTSLTLDASGSAVSGSASYSWSTGATTPSIEVTNPEDYTVTVTNTATGCSDTSTVTIELLPDTEDPVINTCPGSVTVGADSGTCSTDAANVTLGSPVATDNCDSDLTYKNNAPAIFPSGNTTVTWTVTDDAGNYATCTQVVTVVDDQDPILANLPADQLNVAMDTGACGATITWSDPTATDNCDTSLSVKRTDSTGLNSGDLFPEGTTTISYSVTDTAGNTDTYSFNVTVNPDDQGTTTIRQTRNRSLPASTDQPSSRHRRCAP